MPCLSIEVHHGCLCLLALLLLSAFSFSISHCWCPLPHHCLLLWCSCCCSCSFLQKLDAFLNHSTSNQCILWSIQGNIQVLYTNLFAFQRPFKRTNDIFQALNSSEVILITMTMVRCFTSFTLFSSNRINFKIVLNNVKSPFSLLIQSNALSWAFSLPLLAKSLFHYLWQSWLHSKKVSRFLLLYYFLFSFNFWLSGWRRCFSLCQSCFPLILSLLPLLFASFWLIPVDSGQWLGQIWCQSVHGST